LTRRMRCDATGFEHIFAILGLEATLERRQGFLSGPVVPQRRKPGRPHAVIAAMSGLMPTMFMTRVRL
jgi:hypothetical protein